MSDNQPKQLEQIRISFDPREIEEIKAQAQKVDQSISMWVESAIKMRLSVDKFESITVRRGHEQLRLRLLKNILDEIKKETKDPRTWIKEAIYFKLSEAL